MRDFMDSDKVKRHAFKKQQCRLDRVAAVAWKCEEEARLIFI
jgi:hypothetical protein